MKCDNHGKRLDPGDIIEIQYDGQFRRAKILNIQDTDIGNLEVELVLDAGERARTTIVSAMDTYLIDKAEPEPSSEVRYVAINLGEVDPPTLPSDEKVEEVKRAFTGAIVEETNTGTATTLEEILQPPFVSEEPPNQ